MAFLCFKNEESNRDRGFWKFNNSLIEIVEYVLQMKKFILDTLNELFNENILDGQVKWEYLKYNIKIQKVHHQIFEKSSQKHK